MSSFMLGLNWEPNIILLKLRLPNTHRKFYIVNSDLCVPQTFQYHCETNTTNLLWRQGIVTLGGFLKFGGKQPTQPGYTITTVQNDGGGLSSSISFMAYSNNGTTIHCIDPTALDGSIYNCSLTQG